MLWLHVARKSCEERKGISFVKGVLQLSELVAVSGSIVRGMRLSWLNAKKEKESYTVLAIEVETLNNSDEE